jgi:predicted nucleic acid-binding protein
MSGDFLDSNVFVYLIDPDSTKRTTARAVVERALSRGGTISFQVVQETLNVMLRKAPTPITDQDASDLLETTLQPLWSVMPSIGLYRRALNVKTSYGYHFYDSLIIAAALEAGCDRLLTEDMQNGQRIESVTIVNPFA